MKKVILFLCICVALTGCFKGKKVVLTDTKTNTSVEITEDGVLVGGDLKLSDDIILTVQPKE